MRPIPTIPSTGTATRYICSTMKVTPGARRGRISSILGGRFAVDLGAQNNKLNIWIESTWKDDDGTLYGAYHYEPDTICFSNQHILTAPRIGWLRSHDNGATWEDLGFIISADPLRDQLPDPQPVGFRRHGGFRIHSRSEERVLLFLRDEL